MKTTANTDHGTVLPSGASALVVDEKGELAFMLAEYADDEHVPVMVQLLAAVAIRSDDEEWVAETLKVLEAGS